MLQWQSGVKVAYVININQVTLRQEDFLGLSGWVQSNHKTLKVEEGGGMVMTEDVTTEAWSELCDMRMTYTTFPGFENGGIGPQTKESGPVSTR